jgi:hypothetical protein
VAAASSLNARIAAFRVLAFAQGIFNTLNVLEHSLENRETVERISQFAMLLGVCNRQSP